jgi:hypothetical protein
MRLSFLLVCISLFSIYGKAQVDITNGPENEFGGIIKMNRLLQGDDGDYYSYRVRTKGKGTSFYVERYSKSELKPLFSKKIDVEGDESTTETVLYSQGKVYVFHSLFDKETKSMTLSYQTVASSGEVSNGLTTLITVATDHYQFIDFDVYQNPMRTHFLVKSCYKSYKQDQWQTDFYLYDGVKMDQIWKKTVAEKLISTSRLIGIYNYWTSGAMAYNTMPGMTSTSKKEIEREDLGLVGMLVDDDDNIYYGYSTDSKKSKKDEPHYLLNLSTLATNSTTPQVFQLTFDNEYHVRNLMITKTGKDELCIGGFLIQVVPAKWKNQIKNGIFSFKVNPTTNQVISHSMEFFDDKLLMELGTKPKDKAIRYKIDYTFNIDGATYFVGEEYKETRIVHSSNSGTPGSVGLSHVSTYVTYKYEYRDALVAKLNDNGGFDWIKAAPLRMKLDLTRPHLFKEYLAFASDGEIYILGNENARNLQLCTQQSYSAKSMKWVQGIHGSNFVYSAITLKDGSMTHNLIFKNETFCFAPIQEKDPNFMPPPECENFVQAKKHEIIIYTEDRTVERFSRLVFH